MNKIIYFIISILVHIIFLIFITGRLDYKVEYVKVADTSVGVKTITNVKKNINTVKVNPNNTKNNTAVSDNSNTKNNIAVFSNSNSLHSDIKKEIEIIPTYNFSDKGISFEVKKGKTSINKNYEIQNNNKDFYDLDRDLETSKNIYDDSDEVKIVGRRGEFLYKPSFPYPKNAEKLGLEGEIKLLVLVDANGNVYKATPLNKSNSILEDDAIKRIYQYKIALYNDKNVRCSDECQIVITYKIRR